MLFHYLSTDKIHRYLQAECTKGARLKAMLIKFLIDPLSQAHSSYMNPFKAIHVSHDARIVLTGHGCGYHGFIMMAPVHVGDERDKCH